MKIRWIGHAAFYIETSNGLRIRTDPYVAAVGLPVSNLPADVVTISHEHYDHSAADTVPGSPTVLKGQQDTVIHGIAFRSIPTFHDDAKGAKRGSNAVFLISADGVTLAHMGDLGEIPGHSQFDEMGDVDILCVPVGGTYTLNGNQAQAVSDELEASITIPMHYKLPGLKVNIESADAFVKGKSHVRYADEIVVTPQTLPDEREIVVLKARP